MNDTIPEGDSIIFNIEGPTPAYLRLAWAPDTTQKVNYINLMLKKEPSKTFADSLIEAFPNGYQQIDFPALKPFTISHPQKVAQLQNPFPWNDAMRALNAFGVGVAVVLFLTAVVTRIFITSKKISA